MVIDPAKQLLLVFITRVISEIFMQKLATIFSTTVAGSKSSTATIITNEKLDKIKSNIELLESRRSFWLSLNLETEVSNLKKQPKT